MKEPKPPGEKGPSTRQLRVATMLEHAMCRVLDERSVEDPDLYPGGLPPEVRGLVVVAVLCCVLW